MDQSSRDDTLLGHWPRGPCPGDAVSSQSSRDKRRKRSPGLVPGKEGRAISGVRVLVVDDERKIRELVGSYLERQGYLVTLAATGRAALAAAVREHPDLIVLDLRLPDIAGEEVARSIREVSPVPIIMLTAKSAEDDRVAGLRIGA